MPLTREQFAENATRLQVIVMSRLNRHPLSDYKRMNLKEQRVFDKALNEYIRQLPQGTEEQSIGEDFNIVCHEEVFPVMKPEKFVLERSTDAEIQQSEPEELHKLYGDKIEI